MSIIEEKLNEIIKPSSQKEGMLFKSLLDKSEINSKILDELINKRYNKGQRGKKGFFLSENERNKIGIISQCEGLKTIALLYNSKENLDDSILLVCSDIVESIFAELNYTSKSFENIKNSNYDCVHLNYSASPYIYNEDVTEDNMVTNYVDTIAKVLETMIEFRVMYNELFNSGKIIKVKDVEDLGEYIDNLIIISMRDLNMCAIKFGKPVEYSIIKGKVLKDINGQDCIYKGWNYTLINDDEGRSEPSIYYTYSACSAYISLYRNFETIIKLVRKNTTKDQMECPKIDVGYDSNLKKDYEFFCRLYSQYKIFNKICVDSGHYIDMQICNSGLDITEEFIGFGYTKVSIEDIENSTINDAIINTLLAVVTMVYSGLDLDYGVENKSEEINDRLLYAVQNVLKTYKHMVRLNKTFIIEQQSLAFNESLPDYLQDQIKLLRKQRIMMVSLVPLLIKSYNVLSKYLICYPQKQMTDYLLMILDNRCYDKKHDQQQWSWDKDGYTISTNLMYVSNLQDFYDYYEQYEFPFADTNIKISKIEADCAEKIALSKIQHEQSIKDINSQHEYDVNILTKQISELEKPKPLEFEVYNLIEKYMRENFVTIMSESFKMLRNDNIENNNNQCSEAFKRFFLSFFYSEIRNSVDVGEAPNDTNGVMIKEALETNENVMFDRFSKSMGTWFKNEKGIR